MKTALIMIVLACTLTVRSAVIRADEIPDKALCVVCAVNGETELEKVKAHAEHEGKTYYFCSEKCRDEFVADPIWYVPGILPRSAPSFIVETLDGQDVTSDFAGKVTIVDFWATWCKPCEKSMPELQRLSDEYGDKGLRVMGITVEEARDRETKVAKYLEKHKITYPVFADAKTDPAWYKYRVKAVPAVFLIDPDGQVVAEWRGNVDHEMLAREVARLVEANGQPD